MQETPSTPTAGKLPHEFVCPCGQVHPAPVSAIERWHARKYNARWEPPDSSGYIETGTDEWIPGARDFEGEP